MTLRMRAEVRDAWADALESGLYEQTKGVLAKVEQLVDDGTLSVIGMCCLGVLCDLAVKAGVIPPPVVTRSDDDEDDVFVYGIADDDDSDTASTTSLPYAVITWAGLADDAVTWSVSDPRLTTEHGTSRGASGWNDDFDATFADIAVMVRAIRPADESADARLDGSASSPAAD